MEGGGMSTKRQFGCNLLAKPCLKKQQSKAVRWLKASASKERSTVSVIVVARRKMLLPLCLLRQRLSLIWQEVDGRAYWLLLRVELEREALVRTSCGPKTKVAKIHRLMKAGNSSCHFLQGFMNAMMTSFNDVYILYQKIKVFVFFYRLFGGQNQSCTTLEVKRSRLRRFERRGTAS